MPHEITSDVVIRSRATGGGSEFVVLCGMTARVLGGPFSGMTEAVGFAVSQATTAKTRICYEAHDERGRAIGDRLVLRTTP
jgi:hypothetical protein